MIGLGRWARITHIMNLKQIPGVEIVAVCDLDASNVKEALGLIDGSPAVYNDYRQLLADSQVDAVMVIVPNFLHKDIVLAALQQGKHVFCEKPLATTFADTLEIERAVKASGKILQVGFELRYSAFYKEIKNVIRRGDLGAIRMMSCRISRGPLLSPWRTDDSKTGGVLLELCSHQFDLLTWYADSAPKRVSAFGQADRLGDKQLLNSAWVNIEFENAVTASLGLSLFTPFRDEVTMGITGEEALITCSYADKSIVKFSDGAAQGKPVSLPAAPIKAEHGFEGARVQLEDFFASIRDDIKPMNSVTSSRASLSIAKAAQQSITEHKTVDIRRWTENLGKTDSE